MNKIKLVTHSGRFHADDVFATAVLTTLFDLQNKEYEIIRSRKEDDIESGDIVYDNGQKLDPENKVFDHHQDGGAGERENKVPYAAFGLIWKHYGQDLIKEFFNKKTEQENSQIELTIEQLEKIHQMIDESVVQPIDASDTGYEDYKSAKNESLRTYMLDTVVNSYNTTNEEGYEKAYELFIEVVETAKKILKRELIQAKSKSDNSKKIEIAYETAEDKRIIVLEHGGSWKEFLLSKEEPLYVIFPTVDNDGYMIQAVTIAKSGYELRKPFPDNWHGKVLEELEKETGVEGSKFCHLKGFLCGTETKEQAMEIAKTTVDK